MDSSRQSIAALCASGAREDDTHDVETNPGLNPLKTARVPADSSPMAQFGTDVEADLQILDTKLKMLRTEYEQYFLGSRPREPQSLRGEVQKMITLYCNLPISSTAQRFRFNSLRARFFSLRRRWETTVRKIEEGTYERDIFKADIRSRARGAVAAKPPGQNHGDASDADLFSQYLSARQSCGQVLKGIDRSKLDAVLAQQRDEIRSRYGCEVSFRVVVEDGRAKLKATPLRK